MTLPSEISPDEVVTHYILSDREYVPSRMQVKGRALEPSPRDGSTSVFRIDSLSESKIWELGKAHVLIASGRNLHARADIRVQSIRALSLSVKAKEPPPRHAEIADWPSEKDARIAVAQRLADRASLAVHLK